MILYVFAFFVALACLIITEVVWRRDLRRRNGGKGPGTKKDRP